MDFSEMKKAHNLWKVKLRQMVLGMANQDLNPNAVGVDNACALGKWIYGDGARHANLPEFIALRAAHASFHNTAGAVIREYQAGNPTKAASMIDAGGDFAKASWEVMEHLNRLSDALPA